MKDLVKVLGLIAFFVLALGLYFVLLGRAAFQLIGDGSPAAIGLGIGVLILPLLWAGEVRGHQEARAQAERAAEAVR